MIHLDTNYLIGLVTVPSPFKAELVAWMSAGEKLAVSAVVWSEFLNGPVTPQQINDASVIIEGRVVVFGLPEAEMAARVFNQTGRKRTTRTDCFIAATAICAKAALATQNRKDFMPFVGAGLQLTQGR